MKDPFLQTMSYERPDSNKEPTDARQGYYCRLSGHCNYYPRMAVDCLHKDY
jgi:hypothetical protein